MLICYVVRLDVGKTTTARIFANEINKGQGNPIEVDAASNNGVDNVRTIIDDAKFKPLDSNYKVYIIDECHMLSIGAWNAMLKLLEEPPRTTVFILCTTDPQKIPATILSRVQRYDFQRISFEGIVSRLIHIIQEEDEIQWEHEAIEYIAKVADGGMRDAISLLDKCMSYSDKLTIENVINALGISDYDNLDKLLINLLNGNSKSVLSIIEDIYRSGKDLKQFMKQFMNYVLDVSKFIIYSNYDYIQIPNTIDLNIYIDYVQSNSFTIITDILDSIISLNNQIKYEVNPKSTVESSLLLLSIGGR